MVTPTDYLVEKKSEIIWKIIWWAICIFVCFGNGRNTLEGIQTKFQGGREGEVSFFLFSFFFFFGGGSCSFLR